MTNLPDDSNKTKLRGSYAISAQLFLSSIAIPPGGMKKTLK